MKLILQIESDNAAFEGHESRLETVRILRWAADRIERGRDCGVLLDINGNKVGAFDYEEPEVEEPEEV